MTNVQAVTAHVCLNNRRNFGKEISESLSWKMCPINLLWNIVNLLYSKSNHQRENIIYISRISRVLTLSLREKINYVGFSPKFNHRIIASRGFQIRKDFCDISFRFQDIGITLVLIFFLTVHIFEFF